MGPLSTAFSSARHLQRRPTSHVKDGIGREMAGQFGLLFQHPRKSQGSFTAENLRLETDGFNSPPKEGMLQPGSNPRSWVPEASMLTTRPSNPLCLHQGCTGFPKKSTRFLKILGTRGVCSTGRHTKCRPGKLHPQLD
jgi:hypothetical protein